MSRTFDCALEMTLTLKLPRASPVAFLVRIATFGLTFRFLLPFLPFSCFLPGFPFEAAAPSSTLAVAAPARPAEITMPAKRATKRVTKRRIKVSSQRNAKELVLLPGEEANTACRFCVGGHRAS